MMKQRQCGTFPGDGVDQLKQCGKRGMEIHGPYRGAVMVLMDRVEQRVRSPQHLCGRLMTAEPRGVGGYTKTVKSWERGLRGEARSTSARELLTASITYIKTIYKYEGL